MTHNQLKNFVNDSRSYRIYLCSGVSFVVEFLDFDTIKTGIFFKKIKCYIYDILVLESSDDQYTKVGKIYEILDYEIEKVEKVNIMKKISYKYTKKDLQKMIAEHQKAIYNKDVNWWEIEFVNWAAGSDSDFNPNFSITLEFPLAELP